jgi:hypothetical protein
MNILHNYSGAACEDNESTTMTSSVMSAQQEMLLLKQKTALLNDCVNLKEQECHEIESGWYCNTSLL